MLNRKRKKNAECLTGCIILSRAAVYAQGNDYSEAARLLWWLE